MKQFLEGVPFLTKDSYLCVFWDEKAQVLRLYGLSFTKNKKLKISFSWQKQISTLSLKAEISRSIDSVCREHKFSYSKILWLTPERYLLLRRFSMPKVTRKELASAVILSVRKTLPYKLSDLYFSYEVVNKSTSGLDIVFYAVVKDYVKDFIEDSLLKNVLIVPRDFVFYQLIKLLRSEDSIFSFIYKAEDALVLTLADGYSNILIKELPLRPVSLSEEIDMFMEYYKKQFKVVDLEDVPLYLLDGDIQTEGIPNSTVLDIEDLQKEIEEQVDVSALMPDLFLYMAIGAAFLARSYANYLIAPSSLPVKQQQKKEKEISPFVMPSLDAEALIERVPLKIVYSVLALLVVLAGARAFLNHQAFKQQERKYQRKAAALPKDVFSDPARISSEEIKRKKARLELEIGYYQKLINNKKSLYNLLDTIRQEFRHGIWLNLPFNLSFDINTGRYSLSLTGGVYLSDEEEEVKMLDNLIKRLQYKLKGYFSKIDLAYFRREKYGDNKDFLLFSLRCK